MLERLTKQEYIESKINELLAHKYQNEIALDANSKLDTDEGKKQVESAKFNIADYETRISYLESLL